MTNLKGIPFPRVRSAHPGLCTLTPFGSRDVVRPTIDCGIRALTWALDIEHSILDISFGPRWGAAFPGGFLRVEYTSQVCYTSRRWPERKSHQMEHTGKVYSIFNSVNPVNPVQKNCRPAWPTSGHGARRFAILNSVSCILRSVFRHSFTASAGPFHTCGSSRRTSPPSVPRVESRSRSCA